MGRLTSSHSFFGATMTLCEQLNKLQINQLDHDERFPKEITNLSIHQRLTHMTLHFAKYNGRIVSNLYDTNYSTDAIDMAIICLTVSNMLNHRLSDSFNVVDDIDLYTYGVTLIKSTTPVECTSVLALAISEMAKAMESLDHLEALDYRGTIIKSVTSIFGIMLVVAAERRIDLCEEIPRRLNVVQNRSIFRTKLQTREEQLRSVGYAPGNYTGKCGSCKDNMYDVDKRSNICLPCAEKMLEYR